VSRYLGRCSLALNDQDFNRLTSELQGVGPISFQTGCLSVHVKLPISGGLNLIAIPQPTDQALTFNIPLEQIRGDITGGMARFLAGGLWGMLQSQLAKMVQKQLAQKGMPPETITLSQASLGKSKVGQLHLHYAPLNAWLSRQKLSQGLRLALACTGVSEQEIFAALDVYQMEDGR